MKALTFSTFGNPDVLEYIDIPNPVLKPDELLIEMKAIGLNFADVYRRKGNYHLKGSAPFIAGYEGCYFFAKTQHFASPACKSNTQSPTQIHSV